MCFRRPCIDLTHITYETVNVHVHFREYMHNASLSRNVTYSSGIRNFTEVWEEMKVDRPHCIIHHISSLLYSARVVVFLPSPPPALAVPCVHICDQQMCRVLDAVFISLSMKETWTMYRSSLTHIEMGSTHQKSTNKICLWSNPGL